MNSYENALSYGQKVGHGQINSAIDPDLEYIFFFWNRFLLPHT